MSMEFRVIIYDAELKAALGDPQLVAGPIRDFLVKSALSVEAAAKERAPVDTGRLRSSIATHLVPLRAVVAATVFYAPYVEFGTKPHFPPPVALQPWARRHGFPPGPAGAFLVARAIARRGTKAQPFMRPGLEASKAAIRGFLADAAKAITERWGSHGR